MSKALGLIEVDGYLAAVEAADSALKAASVTLLGLEKVNSAITVVKLTGDVAAVNAAVNAGKASAEALGRLRTSHVIARLDNQLDSFLVQKKVEAKAEAKVEETIEIKDKAKEEESVLTENNEVIVSEEQRKTQLDKKAKEEAVEEFIDELIDAKNKANGKEKVKVLEAIPTIYEPEKRLEVKDIPLDGKSEADYSAMKVEELRRLARSLKLPMTNKQIKFAKKDELIRSIEQNNKAGDK